MYWHNMKVILYMAMSVNGLVARTTGEEDFLSHVNWTTFVNLAKTYKSFIIGRKTYDAVKTWGEPYNFDTITGVTKVIVSSSKRAIDGYLIASSPTDAITQLNAKGFETVLLTGGPSLNSAYAQRNLIDEIILNIEPVIISEGIALFTQHAADLTLTLKNVQKLPEGIVQIHYIVNKTAPARPSPNPSRPSPHTSRARHRLG